MIGPLKTLGAGGALGALVGIALVIWIEPTTNAGAGLIVVVAALAMAVAGQAVRAVATTRRPKVESTASPPTARHRRRT